MSAARPFRRRSLPLGGTGRRPKGANRFLLDGAEVPFEDGDTLMAAATRAGYYIPHLCWHPDFLGRTARAGCARSRSMAASARPAPCTRRARAGGREPTPPSSTPSADAAADAVRRRQPLLPELREERQLPAAGQRLRDGHDDRPALRGVLPRPAGRREPPDRCCSTSTAASCASCACAPAARSTARTCSRSAAAASDPPDRQRRAAARRQRAGKRPTAPRRSARWARSCPSGAALPSRSASGAYDANRSARGRLAKSPGGGCDDPEKCKGQASHRHDVSLAGCFGCHMSLLDIDERLFELFELVEFDRSPLTDIKHCGPCDIG
jgi:hypothetical protein